MNGIVLPADREYIPVLTVKGPWAHMIADGLKTVEIRKWQTDYRGPLAIHVSKSFDCASDELLRGLGLGPVPEQSFRDELRAYIIAVAELESITEYKSQSEFTGDILEHYNPYDWYRPGLFGWRLKDVKKVSPLPHRGCIGLSKVLSHRLEVLE